MNLFVKLNIKNMKKRFLFFGGMILTAMVITWGCKRKSSGAKKDVRPNIIYIMSDDHGYQAVSAYGYGMNRTPNIDRLAKEGAIFMNSFVANSLCAPSRATLLTGKFSHVNGKVDNVVTFDGDQQTFPKLLSRQAIRRPSSANGICAATRRALITGMCCPDRGIITIPILLKWDKRKGMRDM